jgi:photosystem II stability/assembly factor-like uncharacterized protein
MGEKIMPFAMLFRIFDETNLKIKIKMKKITLLLVASLLLNLNAFAQWTALNPNTSDYIIEVQFINANTGFGLSDSKIAKTIDTGASWTQIPIPATASHFYAVNDNIIYLTTNNGSIYKSVDSGQNWTNYPTGYTSYLTAIYFIDENIGFISGDYGKIYKTTDGGITWALTQLSPAAYPSEIYFFNSTVGYIVGEYGTIFKTTDTGNTWVQVSQSPNYSYHLNDVIFTDLNHGYAAGSAGTIVTTTDGGTTWTLVTNPGTTANNFWGIDARGNNIVVCGMNGIILRSADGGVTWSNESYNSQGLMSVSFSDASTAFTCGAGGTMLKYSAPLGLTDINNQPSALNIYPNPFSDETSINYSFEKESNVTISIYDMNGRLIKTLVDNEQQIGKHTIKLNNLDSGIYILKATMRDKSYVSKLVKK